MTCVWPFQVASLNNSHTTSQSQTTSFKNNLRATKNMAIIMGIFIICWTPFLVLSVMESLDPVGFRKLLFLRKFQSVALSMFMFNSVVNPFVYAVRFRNFNVAFRLMFGCIRDEERHTVMESMTSAWGTHYVNVWVYLERRNGIQPSVWSTHYVNVWVYQRIGTSYNHGVSDISLRNTLCYCLGVSKERGVIQPWNQWHQPEVHTMLMFGCIKEEERHTLIKSVTSAWGTQYVIVWVYQRRGRRHTAMESVTSARGTHYVNVWVYQRRGAWYNHGVSDISLGNTLC